MNTAIDTLPKSDGGQVSLSVDFLLEVDTAENVQELLDIVAKWLGQMIPLDRCSVALLETDAQKNLKPAVQISSLSGVKALPAGFQMPLENSIIGKAITAREPIYVPDAKDLDNDIFEREIMLQAGLHSCILAPLLSGQNCLGSLNIAHHQSNKYDQADVDQLQAIARWIATHLRMARHVAQLTHQSRTDYLTGVLNRLAFSDHSSKMFGQWQRYGTPFSLAVIDIDFFKSINDRFGHKAGDEILVALASRIKKRLRNSDVFARTGGEEFAILLSNAEQQNAVIAAQSYVDLISNEPFYSSTAAHSLTVSVGVTWPRRDDLNFDQVMSRADELLYDAKALGRNRVGHSDIKHINF